MNKKTRRDLLLQLSGRFKYNLAGTYVRFYREPGKPSEGKKDRSNKNYAQCCNLSENEDFDGVDIWDIIKGNTEKERTIYWNFKGNKYAIRDNNWKLIINKSMKPEESELYNITYDPYEKNDLAQKRPEFVASLLEKIQKEQQKEQQKDDKYKRSDIE